jgi:hypothetical protein
MSAAHSQHAKQLSSSSSFVSQQVKLRKRFPVGALFMVVWLFGLPTIGYLTQNEIEYRP